MNNDKIIGRKIKFSYGVLVIILFATVCFMTDYILIDRKINKCICKECNSVTTNDFSNNIGNNLNRNESESNNVVFLEKTELNFGCSNEVNARVEDGNLIINYNDGVSEKVIKIKEYDIKYIYLAGFMECDNYHLYFLTNSGDLYEVPNTTSLFRDKYFYMNRIASNIMGVISFENEEIKLKDGQAISSFYINTVSNDNSYNKIYWNTFYGPGIVRNNIEVNW